MDTPQSSSLVTQAVLSPSRPLNRLFDVAVSASSGEVDLYTVEHLTPLARPEIPEGYHRWVEKRQREYRAGRHHARIALLDAGVSVPLVRRGDDGLPLFPAGYHGGITHTGRSTTFAAAVICPATHFVGIDAENHKPLSEGMLDAILLPHEQRRYHLTTAEQENAPDTLGLFGLWVFSMKEAFYKCVYPRCAARFGFLDVDVEVNPKAQTFLATFRGKKYPDVPTSLMGRYQVDTQRIVCGVTWQTGG